MRITVLGAGTWGTALAILLKEMGNDVTLWSAISDELEDIRVTRTHKNLPGAKIPDGIVYEKDIAAVCRGREIVLFVVASKQTKKSYLWQDFVYNFYGIILIIIPLVINNLADISYQLKD